MTLEARAVPTNTYLLPIRQAKIQFVDQGPELENFYSLDDSDILSDAPRDGLTDSLDHPDHSLRRSQTASTIHDSLSPDNSSPVEHHYSSSSLPILSPTSTLNSGSNPRSPLKRPLPDDAFGRAAQRRVDNWQSKIYDPVRTSYRIYDPPKAPNPYDLDSTASILESNNSPKIVEAEYRRLADSAAAAIPDEVLLTPEIWKDRFYWPNKYTTNQCACLMRYFIEKLAPWVSAIARVPSATKTDKFKFDVGDPERHFALAVPQRARRCPPLLNAIFTAAARHLTLFPDYRTGKFITYQGINLPNLTNDTCVNYHQACIAYLKKLAESPIHVQDENLLAAAVILRYYEELDCALRGTDSETSLATFNVVFRAQASATNSSFAASPANELWSNVHTSNHTRTPQPTRDLALHHLKSFQHACFRIALRQETTTAFMKQRPINLPLCATWSLLEVIDEDAPDAVWADRHLHHCAKVLHFCFGDSHSSSNAASNPLSLSNLTNSSTHQKGIDRWRTYKAYQDHWDNVKPLSFSPIYLQDHDPHTPFPTVWYMSETHDIGVQYLDLARILLTVYNPAIPRLGPGATATQKRVSEEVREITVHLCGIAMSNPSNQPARMQAYMAVAVCGERFEDGRERRSLLDLLIGLQRDFGWPTGRTQEELKGAWGW